MGYATEDQIKELDSKVIRLDSNVGRIENKFDQKLEAIDQRFVRVDQRFEELDQKIDRNTGIIIEHMNDQCGRIIEVIEELRDEIKDCAKKSDIDEMKLAHSHA